jgi:DNA-binding beta-propeller fold protein YncE
MFSILTRYLVGSVSFAFFSFVLGQAKADMLFVAQGINSFTKIDEMGGKTTFPVGQSVFGLAIDSSSILYLTLANADRIERFSTNGVDLGQFASIAGARGGQYLALDSTGNLYLSNHNDNTIQRFSPTGVDLGNFASSGLNVPEGIKFDKQGNLYVANWGSNTIRKFSPTGIDLGFFATTGLDHPTDIAFDAQGDLFAANFFQKTVHKFSPTGVDLGTFAAAGIDMPNGIAIDSTGNLFVANTNLGTIREFSPTGADLGNFATVDQPLQLAFLPTSSSVPEPSSLVLLGLGVLGLVVFSRFVRFRISAPVVCYE